MTEDKLKKVLNRLDELVDHQEKLSHQIQELKKEVSTFAAPDTPPTRSNEAIETPKALQEPLSKESPRARAIKSSLESKSVEPKSGKMRIDVEKFIGENLINKIGIGVTIIGVGIGAKYAIDNQLIGPVMRIICGYLIGLGLLGFAIVLKAKYKNFSATLLSGALSILYFITFFAYDFYALMPQILAFAVMVLITAGSIYSAINYNRQVIAHVGLVGAYAVPFLLSNDPGNALVLFSYMSIINIAILVISIKRYWKPLFYSSLGFTWLIFYSWFETSFEPDTHFLLAIVFAVLFFVIFYLTFLAYKLVKSEEFEREDILLLVVNSFVFYGLGYAILSENDTAVDYLGLFTVLNALLHFVVALLIKSKKLTDPNLFKLIAGLSLVFITLSIPIQLDGNWVTLLWIGEAVVLFWVGRSKTSFYEKMAYPLIVISFFSLLMDWNSSYNNYDPELPELFISPVFNVYFLSSLLYMVSFSFIIWLSVSDKFQKPTLRGVTHIISVLIPFIFVVVAYGTFSTEIGSYWSQLYLDSKDLIGGEWMFDEDLRRFKIVWLINYSLLFFTILNLLNIYIFRNNRIGGFGFIVGILTVFIFLTSGLFELSKLRESYLSQEFANYFSRDFFHIVTRYFSIVFVILLLYSCYQILVEEIIKEKVKKHFDIFFHMTMVWILSSELINWLDILGATQSDKLGLSLLWGLYSIFLIGRGIQLKRKHLRIGAISLFGITFIKLFFYDISNMDTLTKTFVFIGLGVLMLVASFLYNKYKDVIE